LDKKIVHLLWNVAFSVLALLFSAGCPEGEDVASLPQVKDVRTVKIALPVGAVWPRAGGNPMSFGAATIPGPSKLARLWDAALGDAPALSPVLDSQGRIYACALGKPLVALGPDGASLWKLQADGELQTAVDGLRASPALAADQIWFVSDRGLAAVGFDGRELFRIPGSDISPEPLTNLAVHPNGGLVVTSLDGTVVFFDANCQPTGAAKIEGSAASPASFDDDGFAYICSSGEYLYKFGPGGKLAWKWATGSPNIAAPAIQGDRVTVASVEGTLFELDLSGRLRWSSPVFSDAVEQERKLRKENDSAVAGLFWPAAVVNRQSAKSDAEKNDAETVIEYAVPWVTRPDKLSEASYLITWMKAEGTMRMTKEYAKSAEAGLSFGAPPAFDSEGRVYVAAGGKLYVYKELELLDEIPLGDGAVESGAQPVIAPGRRILVPLEDGRLVCFGEPAAADPSGSASETEAADESESDASAQAAPDATEPVEPGDSPPDQPE
jgi:outer membrane protein assembly factor BamB